MVVAVIYTYHRHCLWNSANSATSQQSPTRGISRGLPSAQIKLERELGHKLFHRLGRKAVLTEAGIVFLDKARLILFEVESATKQLEDHPSLERKITVGAISTLAPFMLPKLIERCRSRFPNLQVNIREDFKTTLLREMLEGELDLALVARPVTDPNIHVELLCKESLMLVVQKGHPLVAKQSVVGADLAGET